ncbi:MAG: hypothetical protein Q9217_002306 [Psora testacea]
MVPTTEYDVFVNQTNLDLARSQRMIASWLPPRDPNETESRKSDADWGEEDEKGYFVAEPEILGVGAKPPLNTDVQLAEPSSNEKLRRQLLGKDYDKKRKRQDDEAKNASLAGSKARPLAPRNKVEEESEEEQGRSGLGKTRAKQDHEVEETRREMEEAYGVAPAKTIAKDNMRQQQTKVGGYNYLDELLAEKARKKQRKKSRKRKGLAD